ncbi:MAG: hypothetical protein Q7R99_03535 [bacterium]|nr:hypothetical protein [bacterium]
MEEKAFTWQGLPIKQWKNISVAVLLKTSMDILEVIASAGWPIRILKDNVFQFGQDNIGTIESFEIQRGSVIINLKLMNIDPELKRSNVHAVKLSKKNGFSLGLPVFKK